MLEKIDRRMGQDLMINLKDLLPLIQSVTIPVLVSVITMLIKKNYDLREEGKQELKAIKKEEIRQADARGKVLMYMSRQELLSRMGTALQRGYTTQKEYDELSQLYDAYISLGGNSTAKHLWEDRYTRLPLKNEEV